MKVEVDRRTIRDGEIMSRVTKSFWGPSSSWKINKASVGFHLPPKMKEFT